MFAAAKDSFGELALMYGYKRAATVQANTDVKLWALDGATFRAVVVQVYMWN
jgi:cAMP-dependent protein kinase regulator